MLGQCLLIGAVAAGSFSVAVLLVIAAAYLFFVGLEGLKRARLRQQAKETSLWKAFPFPSKLFLLASASLGGTALLGWSLPVLIFWGGVSLVLVVLYAVLLFRRRERTTAAEWLGILGITLAAGVAWSAGSGRLGPPAFYIWGVCFLYFAGSVPYVRLRVKQMKSGKAPLSIRATWAKGALLYGVGSLVLVIFGAAAGAYAWLMIVPFVLAVGKLLWVVARDRAPGRLSDVGYAEVFYSSVFTVIAIVAFWPR